MSEPVGQNGTVEPHVDPREAPSSVLARVELLERYLRGWTVHGPNGKPWPRTAQQHRAAQIELCRLVAYPPPPGSYVPRLVEPVPPCWWCCTYAREELDGRERCLGCGTWLGLPPVDDRHK